MTTPVKFKVPRWLTAFVMFAISAILLLFSFLVGNGLVYYTTTMLVCVLLWMFVDRQPLEKLGVQFSAGWWRSLGVGLLLGSSMMGLIVILELLGGWITLIPVFPVEAGGLAGLALILYAGWQTMVAVGEELVARGYFQQNLATHLRLTSAVALAAVMFSALHLPRVILSRIPIQLAVLWLFNLVIAGAMLGLAFVKARNLWLPIGIHFGWNYIMYHAVGFEGNGIHIIQTTGVDLLTGGITGPEAGLIGTLAFSLLAFLAWYVPQNWLGTNTDSDEKIDPNNSLSTFSEAIQLSTEQAPQNICLDQSPAKCTNCPLTDQLECRFQKKSLLRFLIGFLPLAILAFVGVFLAGYGWFLLGWIAYLIFFLQVWENRILCSHCPYYAIEGRILCCHANYGLVKLWKYHPEPMSRSEKIQFLIGIAIFVGYPLPFMVLGQQYLLLALTAIGILIFFMVLVTSMCSRCVNFSCPLNHVPKKVVDAFLKRNLHMRTAWEEKGYQVNSAGN